MFCLYSMSSSYYLFPHPGSPGPSGCVPFVTRARTHWGLGQGLWTLPSLLPTLPTFSPSPYPPFPLPTLPILPTLSILFSSPYRLLSLPSPPLPTLLTLTPLHTLPTPPHGNTVHHSVFLIQSLNQRIKLGFNLASLEFNLDLFVISFHTEFNLRSIFSYNFDSTL